MKFKNNSNLLKKIKMHAETSIEDKVVFTPTEFGYGAKTEPEYNHSDEDYENDNTYNVSDDLKSQEELDGYLDDTDKPTPDESIEIGELDSDSESDEDDLVVESNEYGIEVVDVGINVNKNSRNNVPYISETDIDDGKNFGGGVIKGTTSNYDGDDDNSPDSMKRIDPNAKTKVKRNLEDNSKKVGLQNSQVYNPHSSVGYNLYGFYIVKNYKHLLVDIVVPSIELAKAMIDGNKFIQVRYIDNEMVTCENEIIGGTPGISMGYQELAVYKNNEWVKV